MSFIKKGVELQEDSETVEEAKRNFEKSCDLCYRAGYCEERKCPIFQAHETRLLVLKANEMNERGKAKGEKRPYIVETKPYHQTSLSSDIESATKQLSRLIKENPEDPVPAAVKSLLVSRNFGLLKDCMISVGWIKKGKIPVNQYRDVIILLRSIITQIF